MHAADRDRPLASLPGSPVGTPADPEVLRRLASGRLGERGSHGSTADVVDGENRNRETHTRESPFRMICSIEIAFGAEPPVAAATGWLVGQRTVVTAGHVLWWDRKVSLVRVIPGRNGFDAGREAFESTNFHFHPEWTGSAGQQPQHDIAAIRLPQPVGEQVGWFGVGVFADAALDRRMINIAGYPSVVTDVAVDRCKELWFEVNSIAVVEPERLFYGLDTSAGQSGAPVMLWPSPLVGGGPPMVVGVHARGFEGTGKLNSATRIDASKIDLLGGWVATDNAAG